MDGLAKLPGITMWTSPVAERRVAVVSFVPGTLDANKLADALYTKTRSAVTTRGGKDRPGLRVSPHFYNSPAEVDRLLAGLAKYPEERRLARRARPRATSSRAAFRLWASFQIFVMWRILSPSKSMT